MKNLRNEKVLATLALIVAGILGGFTPIATKIALVEATPLLTLFIRLTITLVPLIFISGRSLLYIGTRSKEFFLVTFFWAGNIILFNIGIPHTTAIASQILYAAVPIFVLLESVIWLKERLKSYQVVGLVMGLVGVLAILMPTISGSMSFGNFEGYFLIFLATICWSLYMISARKYTNTVSAFDVLLVSVGISWIGSLLVLIMSSERFQFYQVLTFHAGTWLAFFYLGVIGGLVMLSLFQWGASRGSSIVAGSTIYLSVLSGTIGGILILHEQLTGATVVGALLLISGVFLTSTLPLLSKFFKT